MSVIVYDKTGGDTIVQQSYNRIMNRYAQLKTQLMRENKNKTELKKFQQILNRGNQILSELSVEQIEKILKENTSNVLSSALETNAENTHNLISKNNYFFEFAKDYNSSVGKIIQLADFANRKNGVKIKSSEFNTALLKSSRIRDKVGKAANALGEIGSIAGNIKTQEILDQLLKDNFKSNSVIVPTGTKKAKKQTVTTDNVVLIMDNNNNVVANINISNKFNTAYKANATNTKKPVKMATRTVANFLDSVTPQYKSSYENALMNLISYHKTFPNGHFERMDFIPSNGYYSKEWQDIRRAVSAEMLYNMTKGTGAQMNVQGHTIKDEIHLYSYGDKFFLHSDVTNSAFRNGKDISPAVINIASRKNWFTTRQYWGYPIKEIIRGREDVVEQKIKRFSIIYNQRVYF